MLIRCWINRYHFNIWKNVIESIQYRWWLFNVELPSIELTWYRWWLFNVELANIELTWYRWWLFNVELPNIELTWYRWWLFNVELPPHLLVWMLWCGRQPLASSNRHCVQFELTMQLTLQSVSSQSDQQHGQLLWLQQTKTKLLQNCYLFFGLNLHYGDFWHRDWIWPQ